MKSAFLYLSALAAVVLCSCSSESSSPDKQTQLQQLRQRISETRDQLITLEAEAEQLQNELTAQGLGAKEESVLVRSFPLRSQSFQHAIEVRGSVRSDRNIIISAEVSGRIQDLPAQTGSQVQSGALLLRLDTELLQNNLEEIENELTLATLIHERQKKLWEQDIGTEIQYLEKKYRMQALQKKRSSLRTQLKKSYLRAPFSGTIEEVFAQEGEMAAPGMPLLRIFTPNDLYIHAEVSDTYIDEIQKGSPVLIRVLSSGLELRSTIAHVGSVLNDQNRTFSIRVDIKKLHTQIYPNQVVTLLIENYAKEDALVTPSRLIQTDSKGSFIYRIKRENKERRAEKIYIQTGLNYQGRTEITAGLQPGDEIIDQGALELTPNALVEDAEKDTYN